MENEIRFPSMERSTRELYDKGYAAGLADGKQLGKIECAATHFKPDWQIKAREIEDASEEGYLTGEKKGREDALKEVGEWLGKCHTYEDPKYRGRCELCDGIKALLDGRLP